MASNGRAINIVRLLRERKVEGRLSPYNSNGNRVRDNVANPIAMSLTDDKISRCLQTVELALRRSNQEEAVAAVERVFLSEPAHTVTIDSHLEELGLRDALIDTLNTHNIFTIADLTLLDIAALRSLQWVKEEDAETIILSVEKLGFEFAEDDA